jgi:hypothetical protein
MNFYRFLSSLLRYIFPNLLKLAFFSSRSFTFNWCQRINKYRSFFAAYYNLHVTFKESIQGFSAAHYFRQLPRPCPRHILFPMAAAVPSSALSPSSGPVSVSLPCAAPSPAMPLSPFSACFRLFFLISVLLYCSLSSAL